MLISQSEGDDLGDHLAQEAILASIARRRRIGRGEGR